MATPALRNNARPVNSISIARPGDIIVGVLERPISACVPGYSMHNDLMYWRVADGHDPSFYVDGQNVEVYVIDGDTLDNKGDDDG